MAKLLKDDGETVEFEADLSPRNMVQRQAFAGLEASSDSRRIDVVVSTPSVDRAGDIIEVEGIDLGNYKANPVVLLQHNQNHPIAKCVEIKLAGGKLMATAEFPPAGVSAVADQTLGLIRAGVLGAVSIGVLPREWSFLDDKRPWAGTKYIKSEMLEFSVVALPMNAEALIVGRALGQASEAAQAELKSLQALLEREVPAEPEAPTQEELDATAAEAARVEAEAAAAETAKAARLRVVQVLRLKAAA